MRVSHNRGSLDVWTPAHALWGGMLRYVGASAGQLILVGLGSAVLEDLAAPLRERLGYPPETAENAGMDIVASLVGWKIADTALRWRPR